ncbi:MAG: diaminopimelate decarboxylase, partial [Actinomycetota bacterium]
MADAARTDAAPAGAPWPASAVMDDRGLVLGGVPACELADRFATPLVVVDEDDLRARCREVRSLFPRACYAVKAFTAHAALRIVLDE